MANTARSRTRAVPAPEPEDEDILELGTDVALAVFQAMVSQGVDPAEAVTACWKFPVKFLQARQAWYEAVQEAFGDD